jgi:hypothetical protein
MTSAAIAYTVVVVAVLAIASWLVLSAALERRSEQRHQQWLKAAKGKRDYWLIHEWPHSQGLGERWVAHPPVTPPGQKWPGLKFFPTRDEAFSYAEDRPAFRGEGE